MRLLKILPFLLALTSFAFAQSSLSVKDETVTLFSGPDAGTYEIAILKKGDVVDLIRSEYGSEWYYVSFKGARGWINKSHLSDGAVERSPAPEAYVAAGKSERTVVDEHIDEVISRSPKSVRDRGLGELKEQRTVAYGDLDDDGDDDIVAGYVIGVGSEPRSVHVAVFLNTEGAFRLAMDERLAAGMTARVVDVYGRRIFIEVAGETAEFELVSGRLARVQRQDQVPEPQNDTPVVDSGSADTPAEPVPDDSGAPPPPPPAPPEIPTRISKGIVNGAAIELPRPLYPAAARAVGAAGTVNVAVVISSDGNVISAYAVSGHPLLRSASVDAARQARFRPTLLSGQPVEVSGIIVYNFGPPPGEDPQ